MPQNVDRKVLATQFLVHVFSLSRTFIDPRRKFWRSSQTLLASNFLRQTFSAEPAVSSPCWSTQLFCSKRTMFWRSSWISQLYSFCRLLITLQFNCVLMVTYLIQWKHLLLRSQSQAIPKSRFGLRCTWLGSISSVLYWYHGYLDCHLIYVNKVVLCGLPRHSSWYCTFVG